MAGAWWESHPRGVYAARARNRGRPRSTCVFSARPRATAPRHRQREKARAPLLFLYRTKVHTRYFQRRNASCTKNPLQRTRRRRRLRARHGAPPRVRAARGRVRVMCMLWHGGSGRAVRQGGGGRISALGAVLGAGRRRAPAQVLGPFAGLQPPARTGTRAHGWARTFIPPRGPRGPQERGCSARSGAPKNGGCTLSRERVCCSQRRSITPSLARRPHPHCAHSPPLCV